MKTTMIAVAAAAVVATAGAGATAWAQARAASSPAAIATPAPTTTSAAGAAGAAGSRKAAAAGHKAGLLNRLMRVDHATWVTEAKDGTFVTHQAIRGTATAVSATSVTLKSADGTTMTLAVNADTKVLTRGDPRTAGKLSDLKVGERLAAAGTGAETPLATRIFVGVR